MTPTLRPYQRQCVDALFTWVSTHDGHCLVCIPTGGGKSLIMGTIINEALSNAPAARALILAHRKELIQQNVKAVASVMPLGQIGIYSAGLKSRDCTSPIIVAGIQSIARRPFDAGAFDLILIDESHLVPTEDDTLYRKFIKAAMMANPHVRFIGLTATPYRLGHGLLHRGRGALFTDIAYEASVKQLIADGYLCRLISKATLTHLDTRGVDTRGGEFVPGQLEAAVDQTDTNKAAVGEMVQLFAERRHWLIFCAGVKHAEHIAEALKAAGIPAAAVHGSMPDEDRRRALDDFKAGALRAVTSMDVLTTGFDFPKIDAIGMLRPTKSTGLYVQMAGRGFRIAPGKTDCLVLDFAGNVSRHGPVDAIEIQDNGSSAGGEGAAPTKVCPKCLSIEHASVSHCSVCGFEFPKPEKPPIFGTASDDPILSDEPKKTTWHEITEVEYYPHQRDETKTPTLRVEYYAGFHRVAMEWICLEHDGYAREKAERWWTRRSPDPVPDTIVDALRLVDELIVPTKIGTVPDGRWTRIVEYELPDAPGASIGTLPRACWSCGYWFEKKQCCRKWDAEPPPEVRLVGCDAWVEEDIPF